MIKRPIYIVDNDTDDQDFLSEAFNELGYKNPLLFFRSAEDVVLKLKQLDSVPFLILCDVNLPKVDGFELKAMISKDDTMNFKSIPFIFWSGTASEKQIKKAYDLGAHGFFIKGSSIQELKQSVENIMTYWLGSKQPQV